MKVSIFRSSPTPKWRSYDVPYTQGMTVLDVIIYVQQHRDPMLAFRYECRQGICGTCGVMYNATPVLSCTTQIDPNTSEQRIAPLDHFPVEKDLIVDLTGVLKRYEKVKPFLNKYHGVLLSKAKANESKPFRKCIECGCCIAGSPTVDKHGDGVLDPMALVKIARYVTDPRDGLDRRAIAKAGGADRYSASESKNLTKICPRGVPIDKTIRLLKQLIHE